MSSSGPYAGLVISCPRCRYQVPATSFDAHIAACSGLPGQQQQPPPPPLLFQSPATAYGAASHTFGQPSSFQLMPQQTAAPMPTSNRLSFNFSPATPASAAAAAVAAPAAAQYRSAAAGATNLQQQPPPTMNANPFVASWNKAYPQQPVGSTYGSPGVAASVSASTPRQAAAAAAAPMQSAATSVLQQQQSPQQSPSPSRLAQQQQQQPPPAAARSPSSATPSPKLPRSAASRVAARAPRPPTAASPPLMAAAPPPPKAKSALPAFPECAVFYPSEEQFADPIKFLMSIREMGAKYGVCKIVPPSDAWLQNKPFTKIVNPRDFIFETKLQNLHQLQNRIGPYQKFMDDLERFLAARGISLKSTPTIDGQTIDLYKLHKAVAMRGGMHNVSQHQRWKDIVKELRVSPLPHASSKLRDTYQKYLYEYDQKVASSKAPRAKSTTTSEPSKSTKGEGQAEEDEGEEVFGYDEGRMFSLATFKKMAHSFKKKWFRLEEGQDSRQVRASDVEEEYWRIIEDADENVQTHYGSDLDVAQFGSGFPREEAELVTASGWNLNKFPTLKDSLLSYYDEKIPGVSVPMMYIGMLFSTFCWHAEDNYLYSINYLHHGAPKTWYGVPASHYEHFEEVFRSTVPDLLKQQPDLIYALITMISPRILSAHKVPVYHTIQKAGEFVITFPKAFHAGFSHGFNCAESCNFALDDWFPFGRESIDRYRTFGKPSVFPLEKLLCRTAILPHSPVLGRRLRTELIIMKQTEMALRRRVIYGDGTWRCVHFEDFEVDSQDQSKECAVCKYDCYSSALVCPCAPGRSVCLHHSADLCRCPGSRRIMLFRWRAADIDKLIQSLESEDQLSPTPMAPTNYELEFKQAYQQSKAFRVVRVGLQGRGRLLQSSSPSVAAAAAAADVADEQQQTVSGATRDGVIRAATVRRRQQLRRLARRAGLQPVWGVRYGDDDMNEGMLVVEDILQKRTGPNGTTEYLLKWEGYPTSESTWETADNFYCPRMLDKFRPRNEPRPKRLRVSNRSSKFVSKMM